MVLSGLERFQGVLEGLAHYWHTMANRTQLPYYLPPESFRHDDKQSFFFTIRRLYPHVIEELAVTSYPLFREAVGRYHRDNQDTEMLYQVRDSIRAWQARNKLEVEWVYTSVNQILFNWFEAERHNLPLLERREPAIFGLQHGPPAFLGDLKRFPFEYPGFKFGFNRGRVRNEVERQFKQELNAWLDKVEQAYRDNGWKLHKEEPERQRNFEIIVEHIVGGLDASQLAEVLDPTGDSETVLNDIYKAISILKARLSL